MPALTPPGLNFKSCWNAPGGSGYPYFSPYIEADFLGISGKLSSYKIALIELKLPSFNLLYAF